MTASAPILFSASPPGHDEDFADRIIEVGVESQSWPVELPSFDDVWIDECDFGQKFSEEMKSIWKK